MDRWWERSACLGMPTELWFPEAAEDEESNGSEAKRICAGCPVIRYCLHDALARGERTGIWGGIGRDRRHRIRGLMSKAERTGNWIPVEAAIGAELDDLARMVSGFEDDRPALPASSCSRCGAMVPAGVHPVDRNGPNATCGLASTYNKGCRCVACSEAKAKYDRVQKQRRRQRDAKVADSYNEPGREAEDPTAEGPASAQSQELCR